MNVPLVSSPTRSQSESVETVLNRLRDDEYIVPDYQRDAGQWTLQKESRFIESVLNNLTVPAFFLWENGGGVSEIVDGQQRIGTLRRFYNDELILSNFEDVDYLMPQSVAYAGKKFSELDDKIKKVFRQYPVTLIFLPSSMEHSTKLEVFRRINEGGTPLTGQDIRLAYYNDARRVCLIRLAGIYDTESVSSKRMISHAQGLNISYPWLKNPQALDAWSAWWAGKERAKGQTPSHMFLWYLSALSRDKINSLLNNTAHLNINFRGTIDEALDIYCAQLLYEERDNCQVSIFASYDDFVLLFEKFSFWFGLILNEKIPNISVEKYRQLAIFIAVVVECGIDHNSISDEKWNGINSFISNPRDAGRKFLGDDGYPEPKGRWTGTKGQLAQFNRAINLVQKIVQ